MKAAVIYPPQADPCQPYSAPAYIASVLKSTGHEIYALDLNLKFFDEIILSHKYLKQVQQEAEVRLEELDCRNHVPALRLGEYERLGRAVLTAPFVLENVNRAKAIFHGPEFYQVKKYNWAFQTLERVFELATSLSHPTRFDLQHFDSVIDWEDPFREPALLNEYQSNFFLAPFEEHLGEWLTGCDPELFAISVTYPTQVQAALTLAILIKQLFPNAHICMGGATLTRLIEADPTYGADKFLDFADSLVLFEGEGAIVALADQLCSGNGLSKTPNLVFRDDESGELVRGDIQTISNLDQLPCPAYVDFPLQDYYSPEPALLLEAARGCYWRRCAFCQMGTATSGPPGTPYRIRSPEVMADQAKQLRECCGARHFTLAAQAIPPDWLTRFAKVAVAKGLDITWDAETRIDPKFDEKLCHTLFQGGCRHIRFGFETSSDRLLKLMDKGVDFSLAKRVFEACANSGIHVSAMSIVGFPTETIEEARNTQVFLETAGREAKIDFAPVAIFSLERGSDVEKKPEKYSVREVLKDHTPALANRFRYRVEEGLSQLEGMRLVEEINLDLTSFFPARDLLCGGGLGHCHTLLYCNRFPGEALGLEYQKLLETEKRCQAELPPWVKMAPRIRYREFRHDMGRISEFMNKAEREALWKLTSLPVTADQIRNEVAEQAQKLGLEEPLPSWVVFRDEDPDIFHYIGRDLWKMLSMASDGIELDQLISKFLTENGTSVYNEDILFQSILTLLQAGLIKGT